MLWAIRKILFGLFCLVAVLQTSDILAQSSEKRGISAYSELQSSGGLKFIPNRGQLSDQYGQAMPDVLYTLDGYGMKSYFTKESMHYVFSKCTGIPQIVRSRSMGDEDQDTLSLYRVDVKFTGSNPNTEIIASDTTNDYTNYYLTNCPDGITHVPGFRKIIYRNIYPKIDLALYTERPGANDYLEYDFIVHPGGDPGAIQISYDHATSLGIGENGSFKLVSPFGQVEETKPNGYQIGSGTQAGSTAPRESVQCGFRLKGNNLSFETGDYDRTRDLVIDPQRLWGTFFGGHDTTTVTYVQGVAADRSGSVAITGYTTSNANIATSGTFHTTYGGAIDGFIARFGPDGSIRWSTYFGGNDHDESVAIASDTGCGILVAGFTGSKSAIASTGAFQTGFTGNEDAFLASFDSTGSRRWATYYSGNGLTPATPLCPCPANTKGTSVAVDSAGNIVLAGETACSSGFATSGAYLSSLAGNQDAYIAKFSPSGSRLWGTYFGGTGGDAGTGNGLVSIDANSNIYLAGATVCTTGIATSGAYQTTPGGAFLAKFSSSGAINWATFYTDTIPYGIRPPIQHIAVSRSGNLYFVGNAIEPGLATPGAYQRTVNGDSDAIIGKFNTNGRRVWVTYYGGVLFDILYGVTLDTAENIFACGYTESATGIATTGEYQTTLLGPYNPFIVKLDSGGHRRWATYYGRRGWGYSIALDRGGHPFVGGWTNTGTGEYATSGAYDSLGNNNATGFLAKFCDPPEVIITSNAPSIICPNSPVTMSTKAGLNSYQWYVNDNAIPGANSATYSFQTPLIGGNYQYTVDVIGTDMCDEISDTVSFRVRQPSQITFPAVNSVCPGSSIKLMATASGAGPLTYSWTPSASIDHPDSLQPNATPTKTTTYTLAVTDTNGCTTTKQVTVAINNAPKVNAGGNRSVCATSSIAMTATATGARAPYTYSWSPSTGLDRTDSSTVIASPKVNTTYVVEVTDDNGCTSKDSSFVIVALPPKISPGPSLSVCIGSSIKIGSTISGGKTPYTILWTPAAGLSNPALSQPTASPDSTTLYTILVTDKNGCTSEDSVLVTVSDSLIPTVTAGGPLTICTGDTVHLTAGTGYSTYVWSSGEKISDISVTKSGDYYVHVTNGSGCAGTSSAVHITVLPDSVPRPLLSASGSTIFCQGDSVEISASGSYASYLWSTGETTPTIYVSQSDSITVAATNADGCIGTSAPLAITVAPKPNVALSASGPTTFCSGDSVVLTAPSGASKYSWSTGDSTSSIVIKKSGTYFVTATNAGGCSATSASVPVTVNAAPAPVISGPSSICPNSSASYGVSNVANDNYLWTITPSGAGTIGNASSSSISVQWGAAANATLSLTETSPDGCSAIVSMAISITSNLTPVITSNGSLSLCQGDSLTLDAGSGYSTYQWSKDGSTITGATNETITVDQAGGYSVFVTAAGGCSGSSAPSVVAVYSPPAKPTITRNGTVLASSAWSQYQWFYGDSLISGATSQTITPDTDGLYSVTITDTNGCTSTSDPFLYSNVLSVVVSVPPGILAAPGATVSIPVMLDSIGGLIESGAKTYVANIALDRTMLTPVNPTGVLVGNNWIVSLTGPAPSASGILQTITALALDSGYCSNVQIDTFYFPGAALNVNTESGVVCLTGTCRPVVESSDTAFTIKRVFPNPSDGSFTIEYHVASDGPLAIYLEDYLGRNVQQLKNEWSQAGDENETYSAQSIPSGVYRLVLRSGERVLNKMVVFAK